MDENIYEAPRSELVDAGIPNIQTRPKLVWLLTLIVGISVLVNLAMNISIIVGLSDNPFYFRTQFDWLFQFVGLFTLSLYVYHLFFMKKHILNICLFLLGSVALVTIISFLRSEQISSEIIVFSLMRFAVVACLVAYPFFLNKKNALT